jgi:hypothetical protein
MFSGLAYNSKKDKWIHEKLIPRLVCILILVPLHKPSFKDPKTCLRRIELRRTDHILLEM